MYPPYSSRARELSVKCLHEENCGGSQGGAPASHRPIAIGPPALRTTWMPCPTRHVAHFLRTGAPVKLSAALIRRIIPSGRPPGSPVQPSSSPSPSLHTHLELPHLPFAIARIPSSGEGFLFSTTVNHCDDLLLSLQSPAVPQPLSQANGAFLVASQTTVSGNQPPKNPSRVLYRRRHALCHDTETALRPPSILPTSNEINTQQC
jgi:hypothetical protein